MLVHNPDCTKVAEGVLARIRGGHPNAAIFRTHASPLLDAGVVLDGQGIPNRLVGPAGNWEWFYHDVVHDPVSGLVWDRMGLGHNSPVQFEEWITIWEQYWGGMVFYPHP